MAQNNLIEDHPDNMLFLKSRKIFQVGDTIAPIYESQIEPKSQAKIIILVGKIDYGLANPNNKELLEKMRKAMESIGGSSYVIEIDPDVKLSWSQLKDRSGVNHYILFGLDFSDIGIQANSFKNSIIPFESAFFILSNKLSYFHTNADLKNVIWKKMKGMVEKSSNA